MSDPGDRFFVIDERQLAEIQAVASRLYSENRMDGDTMRNLAQALDGIVRTCRDFAMVQRMAGLDT